MRPMHHHPRVLIFIVMLALALVAPLCTAVAIDPDDDPGSPVLRSRAMAAQATSVELDHAAIATTLFDAVFNGDTAPGALISANAVIRTSSGTFTGPDGLRDYLDNLSNNYPDASFDVSSIDVQGDTVVIQWTMYATRYQHVQNIEPIHVLVSIPGETTITIADGQVAEIIQTDHSVAAQPSQEIASGTFQRLADR